MWEQLILEKKRKRRIHMNHNRPEVKMKSENNIPENRSFGISETDSPIRPNSNK
jgi:hypothetical protein